MVASTSSSSPPGPARASDTFLEMNDYPTKNHHRNSNNNQAGDGGDDDDDDKPRQNSPTTTLTGSPTSMEFATNKTNYNNDNANHPITGSATRSDFALVVQQWVKHLSLNNNNNHSKSSNAHHRAQNKQPTTNNEKNNNENKNNEVNDDDNMSFEVLYQEMMMISKTSSPNSGSNNNSNSLQNMNEKLLFAAKNGKDEVSLQLFQHLLMSGGGATGDDVDKDQDTAVMAQTVGSLEDSHSSNSDDTLSIMGDSHVTEPVKSQDAKNVHLHQRSNTGSNSGSSSSLSLAQHHHQRNPSRGASNSRNSIVFKLEDVKDHDHNNCTLMHLLAQKNKVLCMDYLYRYRGGASNMNLNAVDSLSSTPLLYACGHNSEEAVAWLLSQPSININAKDTYNKCALLLCLKNKNYTIAEMLLSHGGLDVHAKATKGNTVLHVMCQDGDLDAVKFLIERCNASIHRRNNDEENTLVHAIAHSHISDYISMRFAGNGLSKLLISTNTMGRSIIHQVATHGFFDNLILMFKNLTISDLTTAQVTSMLNSPDKNGDTPLILAVKNSRMDMVQFLCMCIEVRINEGDAAKNTALHYAVNAKNKAMMNILTRYGATLKADNRGDDDGSNYGPVLGCINSLSTTLMIIIVVIAFLCVGAIAAISIGFFASNISTNAKNIRRKSFEIVVNYVNNSLQEFTTMSMTADTQINSRFDLDDRLHVLDLSYTVYQANYQRIPLLYAVYFGKGNGAIAGILNSGGDQGTIFDSWDDPLFSTYIGVPDVLKTSWAEAQTLPNTTEVMDPATLANYHFINDAKASNTTVWSAPYVNGNEAYAGLLYITLLFVRREPVTNDFIALFAVDATTDSITQFLHRKAQEDGSLMAIVERKTGYLIGVSDPDEPLFIQDKQSFEATRFDGTKSKNRKLAAMMKYARSAFGGPTMPKVQGFVYQKFLFRGTYQAINVGEIHDQFGIDWIVLQTLPMAVFFQQFYISLGLIIGMTFVLLLVSIVTAVIAARIFMNPLLVLMKQANDIKVLQLEKVEKSLAKNASRFTEMKSLQSSFAAMVKRLKQYRQFIPDHILAVLEAEFGTENVKNQALSSSAQSNEMSSGDTSSSGHKLGPVVMAEPQGLLNKALKSSLVSGHVSVLTVTMPDLTEILEQHSASEISETTKDTIIQLKECVRESNGQFVSISSTSAVIVWNSFIRQSDHLNRACTAADNIRRSMKKLNRDWSKKGLPVLKLGLGLGTGVAYYGNIGSDNSKIFTVVGLPAKYSSMLSTLNMQWGADILITQEVHDAMTDQYMMRPITKVDESQVVFELGESKSLDEWVEELNPNEKVDPWKLYREGFESFNAENYKEAHEKLSQYLNDNPYDIPAQKLVQRCAKKLKIK